MTFIYELIVPYSLDTGSANMNFLSQGFRKLSSDRQTDRHDRNYTLRWIQTDYVHSRRRRRAVPLTSAPDRRLTRGTVNWRMKTLACKLSHTHMYKLTWTVTLFCYWFDSAGAGRGRDDRHHRHSTYIIIKGIYVKFLIKGCEQGV